MILHESQMQALGRGNFFARLHSFLAARLRLPHLVELLFAHEQDVLFVWNEVLNAVALGSEYQSAVFLSYAFCRWSEGTDPLAATRQLIAAPDAEYRAKCYFENSEVMRFSEFDAHLWEPADEAA